MRGHEVDSDEVFRLTTGNPYLVAEILASPSATPRSVMGAAVERLSPLPPDTRDLVEQLAVVPGSVEPRLATVLVGGAWDRLAAAEESGLLTVVNAEVAFRHELTRMAVLGAVPGARQTILHRRVLDALVTLGDADPGRLVHHAVACGDVSTVLAEGPRAAREAAASGSHHAAVSHYRTVLEHEALTDVDQRADLWEELAIEQYLSGDTGGVTAAERAVDLRRTDADDGPWSGACAGSQTRVGRARPGLAIESADEAVDRREAAVTPGPRRSHSRTVLSSRWCAGSTRPPSSSDSRRSPTPPRPGTPGPCRTPSTTSARA